MKIVAVGSLEGMDLDDLEGRPGVLLTGTVAEVRKAGALLLKDVVLRERESQSSGDTGEKS